MAKIFWDKDWVKFSIALLLFCIVVVTFAYIEAYLQQGTVVARVNGERIFESDLHNRTVFAAINDVLLRQAADSRDITASDREVQRALNDTAATHNISPEALFRAMENQGYIREEVRQQARDRVRFRKLFDQEIAVNVTEQQLRQYYEENEREFTSPPSITVYEEACDCTYNVTRRSGLEQEFLERLFNARPGDSFRYEGTVLTVEAKYEERTKPFNAVKERLRSVLERRERERAIDRFLQKLRQQADIENYVLERALERDWTCLRNSTLYGASWDSQTRRQLEELGEAKQYLEYVECSGKDFVSAECRRKGIDAFPTWVIDGRRHPGFMSKDRLYRLACR